MGGMCLANVGKIIVEIVESITSWKGARIQVIIKKLMTIKGSLWRRNIRIAMVGLSAISRINGVIIKTRRIQKAKKASGLPAGVDYNGITFINGSWNFYCKSLVLIKPIPPVFRLPKREREQTTNFLLLTHLAWSLLVKVMVEVNYHLLPRPLPPHHQMIMFHLLSLIFPTRNW